MKEGVYILNYVNPSIPKAQEREIFSTQRIPRWGDHRGAMRQKMAIFKGGNSVCRGYKFFRNGEIIGGDASENGDFQRGKQRLQGRKNFQINFDEFLGTSFSGANVGGRC